MSIKQLIDQDLKTALLAGDKDNVMTLRGLKSVILYAEVAKGNREVELSDAEIIDLFMKEAKKRQESADLYIKGGNQERAQAELSEKKLIEHYLPEQLSDKELTNLIDSAIERIGAASQQSMGQIIATVKQESHGRADGGRIAAEVRSRMV